MILSKERLSKEAKETGYRQEIIEKVVWLIELINAVAEDSYLATRLALKGGTALNLFHFNLPRLSVDADFNYIGAVDRNMMLSERTHVENRLKSLFERMGLRLARHPQEHAGGKMVWRYPSALGNQGNLEVDLNYMYRVPLLPTEQRDSVLVGGRQIKNMQLLDIHELAAGKLTALLERRTGRDFFDAYELFQYKQIKKERLRLMFVVYAAMCTKQDMLCLKRDEITVDRIDVQNKLIPVMKDRFQPSPISREDWVDNIIKEVREGFNDLLPFTEAEETFINAVVNGKGIKPELLVQNAELENLIKSHPALLWAEMKVKK